MEITLKNVELKAIDGKTFDGAEGTPMSLFDACSIALSTDVKEDETVSFKAKCARMDLAKLFVDSKEELVIDSEQISEIEKRAAQLFKSPLCWSIKQAM